MALLWLKTGIVCSGEQGKSKNKLEKQNPALLPGCVRKARETNLKDDTGVEGVLASANMELLHPMEWEGLPGPDFGVGEKRH